MNDDERLYALALMGVAGIGSRRIAHLVARFGSRAAAWQAPKPDLHRVPALGPKALEALESSRRGPDALAAARRELDSFEARGIAMLLPEDPAYPPLLREIPDPPAALFMRGQLGAHGPRVALVGTRAASAYGLRTARRLAAELAERGVTVVSGLAIGIDAAAHAGALEAGVTLAVLGSGVDQVHPACNRRLARQIVDGGGGLLSEYPPATPPAPGQFPARNRIVSGMCHATVVVEAPLRSGALITADLALEQGREVMAVPGGIDQVQSAGALALLSQGAKLVTGVEDILAEIPAAAPRPPRPRMPRDLPPEEARVLEALGETPRHADQVVSATGLPAAVVTGLLLVLELKAFVVQLPGNTYIRHP